MPQIDYEFNYVVVGALDGYTPGTGSTNGSNPTNWTDLSASLEDGFQTVMAEPVGSMEIDGYDRNTRFKVSMVLRLTGATPFSTSIIDASAKVILRYGLTGGTKKVLGDSRGLTVNLLSEREAGAVSTGQIKSVLLEFCTYVSASSSAHAIDQVMETERV